jgi:hypothetical protein
MLDALIVRNIEDIEQAYARAIGPVTETLANAIDHLISDIGFENIDYDVNDLSDPWFGLRQWKSETEGEYDLYFILGFEGDALSWPALLIGANSGSTFFELRSNSWTGTRRWRSFLKEPAHETLREELMEAGFVLDEKAGTLRMPLRLKSDTLAQAYESEDFAQALEPIRRAVIQIIQARRPFDRLVELIRGNVTAESGGPTSAA